MYKPEMQNICTTKPNENLTFTPLYQYSCKYYTSSVSNFPGQETYIQVYNIQTSKKLTFTLHVKLKITYIL